MLNFWNVSTFVSRTEITLASYIYYKGYSLLELTCAAKSKDEDDGYLDF